MLRFIAAMLGAACVVVALAVPLGIISICYEGGCTNRTQEHWLRDLIGLGFLGIVLCLGSLIAAAVLFFYARHGALRAPQSDSSTLVK